MFTSLSSEVVKLVIQDLEKCDCSGGRDEENTCSFVFGSPKVSLSDSTSQTL